MSEQIPRLESVVAQYQGLSLTAKDNQKLLASVLALQGIEVQGFEALLDGEVHLLLKGISADTPQNDVWIDCGRSKAHQASFQRVSNDIEITDCQAVEVPLLDEHRIALMCMQSAHFDHCY